MKKRTKMPKNYTIILTKVCLSIDNLQKGARYYNFVFVLDYQAKEQLIDQLSGYLCMFTSSILSRETLINHIKIRQLLNNYGNTNTGTSKAHNYKQDTPNS